MARKRLSPPPDHETAVARGKLGGRPKAEDLEHRCQAKSKQTGKRCGQVAIPGARVCVYHGGDAPQVKAAATRRLYEACDPALDKLLTLLCSKNESVALSAAREILNRAGIQATEVFQFRRFDVSKLDTLTTEELQMALVLAQKMTVGPSDDPAESGS